MYGLTNLYMVANVMRFFFFFFFFSSSWWVLIKVPSESEYFTGDTSLDIHSSGPMIAKTRSHK